MDGEKGKKIYQLLSIIPQLIVRVDSAKDILDDDVYRLATRRGSVEHKKGIRKKLNL